MNEFKFFIRKRNTDNYIPILIKDKEELISVINTIKINEDLLYENDSGVFVNISKLLSDINIHYYDSIEDFLNDRTDIDWDGYRDNLSENSVTVHDIHELKDIDISTDVINDGIIDNNIGIIDNDEIVYNTIRISSTGGVSRLPGLLLVIDGKVLRKDIATDGREAIYYTEGHRLSWNNHLFIDMTDVGGYTRGTVNDIVYKENTNSILLTTEDRMIHKPWLAFNDMLAIPNTPLYFVIHAITEKGIYFNLECLKFLYRRKIIEHEIPSENILDFIIGDLKNNLTLIVPNECLNITTRELEKHEYLIRYLRDITDSISKQKLHGILFINGSITPYRKMEIRWKSLDQENKLIEKENVDLYPGKNKIPDVKQYSYDYDPFSNTNYISDKHIHPNTSETIFIVKITKKK
jgi:hypothetical protein